MERIGEWMSKTHTYLISDHLLLCLVGHCSCFSLKNFTNEIEDLTFTFVFYGETLFSCGNLFLFSLFRAEKSAGFSLGACICLGVQFHLHKHTHNDSPPSTFGWSAYCNVNMNTCLSVQTLINKVLVWNSNFHYSLKLLMLNHLIE